MLDKLIGFILAVLAFILIVTLTGCKTAQVDWRKAHAIAVEADQVAGAWQAVLEDDQSRIIREMREHLEPVILALARRAADPTAPDPSADLWSWISIASEVAAVWPDERQRRIGLATLSTLRLSLVLAGLSPPAAPHPQEPP